MLPLCEKNKVFKFISIFSNNSYDYVGITSNNMHIKLNYGDNIQAVSTMEDSSFNYPNKNIGIIMSGICIPYTCPTNINIMGKELVKDQGNITLYTNSSLFDCQFNIKCPSTDSKYMFLSISKNHRYIDEK